LQTTHIPYVPGNLSAEGLKLVQTFRVRKHLDAEAVVKVQTQHLSDNAGHAADGKGVAVRSPDREIGDDLVTGTVTVLDEILSPRFGPIENRPITIVKLAPLLSINSAYDPQVLAGFPATFTLSYSNTGGYENDVWITNTFPISATFAPKTSAPSLKPAASSR